MIGKFWFDENAGTDKVRLELHWDAGSATGKVHTPEWALSGLAQAGISASNNDEFLRLPLALSFAILVASAASLELVLTGDSSVWPDEWGEMLRPKYSGVAVSMSTAH